MARAAEAFSRVIDAQGATRIDAALYWKAYALDKLNQQAVIDACAATGTWIELNASPYRFDLDWRLWHYAKDKGVKCVINCDAHRLEHAGFLRLGTGIARKGWLTKADVINTLPLAKLRQELARKRA